MVDKTGNKSGIDKAIDFAKDHWGEVFTLVHLGSGLINGKVSDQAPDVAKSVIEAVTGQFGGKGDPLDEITFKRLMRRLTKQQREFLLAWIGFEFPIDSDDPWIRNKAADALEEFRVLITAMVTPAKMGTRKIETVLKRDRHHKPKRTEIKTEEYEISPADDSDAFAYLQGLAKDIISAFNAEAKALGKKVSELSEEERALCMLRAFAKISESMQRQGSPRVPKEDEKSFARKIRQIFNGVGPITSKATKVAYDVAKRKASRAARVARASEYLAKRKHRQAQQQRGFWRRLADRIDDTL